MTPLSKKAKAKEPDTFDGSEPQKLNNFILLCDLFFCSNPIYSNDSNKVTFMLSYLRGTALEFFEPSLLDSDEIPDWLDDWPNFVQTLCTQFGPIDPTADAEDGIDNLKMHDNQHIVKYNIEFNCLTICTSWDEGVLWHRYYSRLTECIKDIMGQQGKPLTLAKMKTLVHHIDSHHWECLHKKSHAGKNKSDNNDNKPDNKGNKSDDKKNQASGSNKNNKFDKNKKPNKPQSSSGNSESITNKLGKDRKLTPLKRSVLV